MKLKKYSKDSKILLIGLLLLVLLVFLIIKPNFGERKLIIIEDKCGRFVNLISHTIDDESVCRARCRSQCSSDDYKFDGVEFIENINDCNTCNCYCK